MRTNSRSRTSRADATPASTSVAETIAQAAIKAFNNRADIEQNALDNHDVDNADSSRRHIAVLRGGTAWPVNDRTVCATVPDTKDGRRLHNAAAVALDRAGQNLPATAEINQTSRVAYTLTW